MVVLLLKNSLATLNLIQTDIVIPPLKCLKGIGLWLGRLEICTLKANLSLSNHPQ
jgi:hypothetical protein